MSLAGTVKPYKQHIIVCGGGDAGNWPSHIESSHELIRILGNLISEESKLTLCDRPNSSADKTDIIVFPNSKLYQVSMHQLQAFAEYLSKCLQSSKVSVEEQFPSMELPFEKIILVCIHNNRDKRCGRAGPQIVEDMRRRLLEEGVPETVVTVVGSSHIGGHAFAGTLIVYPSSDWYGYVTAKGTSIPSILDAIKNNTVYEKCHRGCANLPTW